MCATVEYELYFPNDSFFNAVPLVTISHILGCLLLSHLLLGKFYYTSQFLLGYSALKTMHVACPNSVSHSCSMAVVRTGCGCALLTVLFQNSD